MGVCTDIDNAPRHPSPVAPDVHHHSEPSSRERKKEEGRRMLRQRMKRGSRRKKGETSKGQHRNQHQQLNPRPCAEPPFLSALGLVFLLVFFVLWMLATLQCATVAVPVAWSIGGYAAGHMVRTDRGVENDRRAEVETCIPMS